MFIFAVEKTKYHIGLIKSDNQHNIVKKFKKEFFIQIIDWGPGKWIIKFWLPIANHV